MGHRTNYILIENQEADIYYAHWDANILGRKLFYGSESLIQYVRPLSVSEKLLDTVWGEGAALIDTDEQKLLFWGDEFLWRNQSLVECFIQMLKETTWKGWQIEWAKEGQADIARYLNIDVQTVINNEADEDGDDEDKWDKEETAKTYSNVQLADLLEKMLNNHLQNLDYDPATTMRDIIKEHRSQGSKKSVGSHAFEHENANSEEEEKIMAIKLLTDWILNLRGQG